MTTGMATKPDRIKEKLIIRNPSQRSFQTEFTPQFKITNLFLFYFKKNSIFLFSCRCTCGVLKDGAIWLLARGDLNAQVAPCKHRCVANLWNPPSSTHRASPLCSLLWWKWNESPLVQTDPCLLYLSHYLTIAQRILDKYRSGGEHKGRLSWEGKGRLGR